MLRSKTVDTLLSELRAATKLSKFYLTSYTLSTNLLWPTTTETTMWYRCRSQQCVSLLTFLFNLKLQYSKFSSIGQVLRFFILSNKSIILNNEIERICWRFHIKNIFYFLRYAHVRYVKSLFANIQSKLKIQNMLKISLLFKKFTNFTGK